MEAQQRREITLAATRAATQYALLFGGSMEDLWFQRRFEIDSDGRSWPAGTYEETYLPAAKTAYMIHTALRAGPRSLAVAGR